MRTLIASMSTWFSQALLLHASAILFSIIAAKADRMVSRWFESKTLDQSYNLYDMITGTIWSMTLFGLVTVAYMIQDLNGIVFILSLLTLPMIMVLVKFLTYKTK